MIGAEILAKQIGLAAVEIVFVVTSPAGRVNHRVGQQRRGPEGQDAEILKKLRKRTEELYLDAVQ